ncbi:uncharacterized protein LOC129739857 [Uranotaenia lowii]|uniref:uncharacterized protein LOC129739857 n=1 Tax=Uranotaenia lowii TaxID=190385 RepID=UPI002479FB84|nr:uncharacterized protein LOC129739857 [Uranotaenia lowii]
MNRLNLANCQKLKPKQKVRGRKILIAFSAHRKLSVPGSSIRISEVVGDCPPQQIIIQQRIKMTQMAFKLCDQVLNGLGLLTYLFRKALSPTASYFHFPFKPLSGKDHQSGEKAA